MPAKLPPGQQKAAPGRWPLVGERQPGPGPADWTVRVHGAVASPRLWTLAELQSLPAVERTLDIHCVTRWSLLDTRWTGVPLLRLLDESAPSPDARFVSFTARSSRGHSTSLGLADIRRLDPLVVWQWQGEPLASEHGGPVRVVVPGKYFYKSLKWLVDVEVLVADRLGYWEAEAGYHNDADPWLEQRFLAPQFTKAEAARLLVDRDLAGRTARGLDASGRDLTRLSAAGALLRDANFSATKLPEADFRGANLSNARFLDADLRGASFANADVEGADFRGADLRGADFRGASLFGALLGDAADDADLTGSSDLPGSNAATSRRVALIDDSTQFDDAALEQLMPAQAAFLTTGRSRRRN